MTKSKQRLLAVDGVEQRLNGYTKAEPLYISQMTAGARDKIREIYERAVWIDSQLNDSCIVDPFFKFHFYEEADAMAFKLKWK